MKKRVPQGKKNEKQTGKASCFQLVEKRIAHFKDSKKLKTANNYACALKHFRDFRANKDLAIGAGRPARRPRRAAHLVRQPPYLGLARPAIGRGG